MLRRFFHLVVGEPFGGFAGTLVDLGRQLWDFMKAYCTRREYASRRQKLPRLTMSIPQFVAMTIMPRVALLVLDASLPLFS